MEKVFTPRKSRRNRENGSVLVILAICIVTLMGVAALAVDIGAVYAAKTQLQIGADAAALAAVQELGNGQVQAVAAQYASLNSVMTTPITLDTSDVVTGYFDFSTGAFTPDAQPPNAVRVTARRTPGSPDGPFELFFGKVIGRDSVSIEAESIAAIDSRVGGVGPADGEVEGEYDLLPFAVALDDVGHLEDLEGNPIDAVDFQINYETGTVTVYDRVDLSVKVLGSQITYGAGGPVIPVYTWASVNDGASYDAISGGSAVSGGEELNYTGVENAQVAIKARALYEVDGQTYFDRTRFSNAGTPYVVVLRRGDIAPEYEGFDGQDEITEFLAPYMDPDTREMTIGANDVIFLFEYVDNLDSSAADFQDLVVLCTFTKLEGEELPLSETRFVANEGDSVDFFPFQDMEAPGNFGIVSLDGYSNGTSTLREWTEQGYPEQFIIPQDPGYLVLNGCPGMHTSIKQSIEGRINDTVLIAVYDDLSGQGNNATYRVPFFLALEITGVYLTGPPESRYIRGTIKELRATNLVITPGAPEHASLGINRMAR